MEGIEITGRTVEEAIEVALKELGLSRDEVEIEIIEREKPDVIGSEARVRVIPKVPKTVGQIAKEIVEKLLFLMKIPATVEVEEGEMENVASINIEGENLGLLVGNRGRTLQTLHYMINLMVSRRLKRGVRINVDVTRYKKRREEELKRLALKAAELVKQTRRSITLEPMPPSKRRIIHLTLRGDPQIITRSEGEGEERRITISYRGGRFI